MADGRDDRRQILPMRPARVQAAETPGDGLAAPLVIAAVIVAALYFGREILIPIAIAVLLSFVIGPLVVCCASCGSAGFRPSVSRCCCCSPWWRA